MGDGPTLEDIQRAVAMLEAHNVPPDEDGRYFLEVHPSQQANAQRFHDLGLVTLCRRGPDGKWVPIRRRKRARK